MHLHHHLWLTLFATTMIAAAGSSKDVTSHHLRLNNNNNNNAPSSSSSSFWNDIYSQLTTFLDYSSSQRRQLATGDFDSINGFLSGFQFLVEEPIEVSTSLGFTTLNAVISDIACGSVTVGDIVISTEQPTEGSLIFGLDVVDFDLICTFRLDSNIVDGNGRVTTNDNDVGLSFRFESIDFGVEPPTSVEIDPSNPCRVNVPDLNFELDSGGFGGFLVNVASGYLEDFLADAVAEQICAVADGLGDGLGTELLAGVNAILAPFLDDSTNNDDDPLGPETSLIVSDNLLNYQTSPLASILFPELNALLGGTAINNLVQENLLDDNGVLSLDINDALNLTDAFNVTDDLLNVTDGAISSDGIVVLDEHNNLTEAKVTVQRIDIYGLDSFTSFGPLAPIGAFTVQAAATLEEVRVEIGFALDIRPSSLETSLHTNPNADPIVSENARLVFGLEDMELTLSTLIGIDEEQAANPLLSNANGDDLIGCLLSSIVRVETSSVNLQVGGLTEPVLEGVAPGLDRIVTETAKAVLIMYEASILQSMENIIRQSLANILLPTDQLLLNATTTTCGGGEVVGTEEVSSEPTSVPSTSPSTTPSATPSTTPSVTPSTTPLVTPESGGFCFSSHSTVQLESGAIVNMNELKLGDKVLVSSSSGNKYEPIYGFGHFDTTSKVDYLQIYTSSQKQPLELTPNHLLFLEEDDDDKKTVVLPAAQLKVGHHVLAGGISIRSIRSVTRTGAFAPYTPSGTIVVNGLEASCFATLDEKSSYVSIAGYYTIPFMTYHEAGLLFESPRRLLCLHLVDCRRYETYTKDGLSTWVAIPMKAFVWLQDQSIWISSILLGISLAVLAVFYMVEQMMMAMLHYYYAWTIMAAAAATAALLLLLLLGRRHSCCRPFDVYRKQQQQKVA